MSEHIELELYQSKGVVWVRDISSKRLLGRVVNYQSGNSADEYARLHVELIGSKNSICEIVLPMIPNKHDVITANDCSGGVHEGEKP